MQPLTLSGRTSIVHRIVNAYHAWRWQCKRHTCSSCAACSTQLEDEAAELLMRGHYRAAVALARLSLELCIRDLHGHVEGKPITVDLAYRLVDRCIIAKPMANRVSNLYGQASRIMRGRACPRGRAVGLVRSIRLLMLDLLAEQQRYVTGSKKGGAR